MGASRSREGDVPTSNREIGTNIIQGIGKTMIGEGTQLNKALRLSPGGKDLDQRMAGDLDLNGFLGSKSSAGMSSSGYGVNAPTKSLRGKYLGAGAASADDVGITEGQKF